MSTLYAVLVVVSLANLIIGLLRVSTAPAASDRVAGLLLFGTAGSATLLLMGQLGEAASARLVALVVVLLSCLVAVVLVAMRPRPRRPDAGASR